MSFDFGCDLANEMAADEIMGWRTGRIFTELASEGVLRELDWGADLNEKTKKLLLDRHSELRVRYQKGADIRTAIENRDNRKLEEIKSSFWSRFARSLHLIVGVTPNSIKLPEWKTRGQDDHTAPDVEIRRFLAHISAPVTDGKGQRCQAFSCVISREREFARADINRQNEVAATYESPMISELLAGEGRFVGAEGFVLYFEALTPHRHSYDPINIQLYTNWRANRDNLFRLRGVAEKHLWPYLHGEWLPELKANPSAAPRIASLMERAIVRSEIGALLTMKTDFILGTISGVRADRLRTPNNIDHGIG